MQGTGRAYPTEFMGKVRRAKYEELPKGKNPDIAKQRISGTFKNLLIE